VISRIELIMKCALTSFCLVTQRVLHSKTSCDGVTGSFTGLSWPKPTAAGLGIIIQTDIAKKSRLPNINDTAETVEKPNWGGWPSAVKQTVQF